MNPLLRRVGGPNAVSRWAFILTFVVMLVATAVPTSRDKVTGPFVERMGVATAGLLAGFLVLAAGRMLVLRGSGRTSRPGTAATVFALAGAANAAVVLLTREALGLAPFDPALTVASRMVAAVLWLSLIAILVDEVRSHAARMVELRSRIDEVAEALRREDGEFDEVAERLRGEVIGPLRQELLAISSRLEQMGGGPGAALAAEGVRRLVEDEVRPLSHDLLTRDDVVDPAWTAPPPQPVRERLRAVVRLSVTQVAAPIWVAVALPVVLLLLFAGQPIGAEFAVLASLGFVVVMTLLFLLARDLLDPVLPHMRTPVAVVVVLITYESLAVAAVFNNYAWGRLSELGSWVEWPALVTLPLIWLGMAAVRGAQREREQAEARLLEVLVDLRLITARRRQRMRHAYQSLGRLLHGDVQAALLAMSHRLEGLSGQEDHARAAEIDQVAHDLGVLGARIADGPREDWTAEQALAGVCGMWAGVLDVEVDAPVSVLAVLDADPPARAAAVDVVAEGLTNAVRHGSASRARVAIAHGDAGRVVVTVHDDGSGVPAGEPGMGMRLLEAVSPRWSLDPAPGGAVLRVEIPAGAVPQPVGA